MDRSKLHDELIRDEGERLDVYKDSRGFWTIGVGHLLGTEPRMTRIFTSESTALLQSDINMAEASARRLVSNYDALSDVRQRALINMIFNRGEAAMARSSTILPAILLALKTEFWTPVKDAILASPWGQQVGQRAVRLAQMFVDG